MVTRIKSGKNIRGVLSYNENKVKEGAARCIDAVGFGCSPDELTFSNKLARFSGLTERNKIAKTNAIHISLNFHPDEKLSEQTLQEIAAAYMEKIGFGDQPYVLYQHFDAAHPHIHIATVNIKSDGKRIDIHNIGRDRSDQARREIEEAFGLIKAGDREPTGGSMLKPADLSKAEYGKRPTKNEISNIVRTVAKYYRYSSFAEYSAILKQYNILTNRGEPDSRMYQNGGLFYQLLERKTGKGVGIPIKSSSIYEKPTLKNIEANYERNKEIRKNYTERTRRTIDEVLNQPMDKASFVSALKRENIIADFKVNDQGYTYGITYIDKTTCCIFNGSDIGKGYSAKAILERLQTGSPKENTANRDFVERLFSETDFSKDFKSVLVEWVLSGALIRAFETESSSIRYKIGQIGTELSSFVPANDKMTRYFAANNFGAYQANTIVDFILTRLLPVNSFHYAAPDWRNILPTIEKEFSALLHHLWEPTYNNAPQPYELLREARKKKRKRNRY